LADITEENLLGGGAVGTETGATPKTHIVRSADPRSLAYPPDERVLRGVQFPDREQFYRGAALLSEQIDDPLEFRSAPDNITVLPQWAYKRYIALLHHHEIPYVDTQVGSFRDLSPKKQIEARGLIWNKG